jgi:hypothetical protein
MAAIAGVNTNVFREREINSAQSNRLIDCGSNSHPAQKNPKDFTVQMAGVATPGPKVSLGFSGPEKCEFPEEFANRPISNSPF